MKKTATTLSLIIAAIIAIAPAADAFILTSAGRAIQRAGQSRRNVRIAASVLENGNVEATAAVDMLALVQRLLDGPDAAEPFFNWPTIGLGLAESLAIYAIGDRNGWWGGSSKSSSSERSPVILQQTTSGDNYYINITGDGDQRTIRINREKE